MWADKADKAEHARFINKPKTWLAALPPQTMPVPYTEGGGA